MSQRKLRVAILVENMHQEMEVWYPIYRFQEANAVVTVIGPDVGKYTSKLGYPVASELAAADAKASHFDVIVIPGGFAPDLMRLCKPMVSLVREMHEQGRIVAAICHGSWLLASADIIRGKRVTGAPSIVDDLRNAGGLYEDCEVVRDGNLISSRKPADIPAFSAAILQAVAERTGSDT
ncbi:type 1 glutamine amidotransferase domain-containing protein [Caenimonas soli]|uniref:type 1 glutamine amidotransferase domain-containing protein n=1 Tax=Caenimonas soli TaxID=2735555 RepID=UPI001552E09A|nr:type 1 glutamine amidotransferase domain-containing protein [Caenimonas soli]NPC59130.1 type 1 glutamine amidotransferase [Caenimonas soli]